MNLRALRPKCDTDDCDKGYKWTIDHIEKCVGLKVSVDSFLQLMDFMAERGVGLTVTPGSFTGTDGNQYDNTDIVESIDKGLADLRKHFAAQ